MTTAYENQFALCFETIDRHILGAETIEPDAGAAALLPPMPVLKAEFHTALASIRPLLAVLAASPLFPAAWRTALQIFIVVADRVSQSAPETAGDFKAGKDL